jgi:hypothetical protein
MACSLDDVVVFSTQDDSGLPNGKWVTPVDEESALRTERFMRKDWIVQRAFAEL